MEFLDLLKAVGDRGGYSIAVLLFSFTVWTLREPIGKAITLRSETKAVDQLNGKLVAAISKAVEPLMEDAVDRRFREMPEFMRDKIKALGEHGANNALAVFELKVSPKIKEIDTRLEEQCERLDRVETSLGTANAGIARIEGRLQGQADSRA